MQPPPKQSQSSNVERQELQALLDEIQKLGGDLGSMPPELAALVQQAQAAAAAPTAAGDNMNTEDITPEPGFVVKTHDVDGRKVFINIVSHSKVAAPGNWTSGVLPDEVQQALDNLDNLSDNQAEALRFPLSVTAPRPEVDKQGQPATSFDCCLNSDVVKMCAVHRPLKTFIIELAINWINHKHKMQLDLKYKLPKMKYKGDAFETHRIRVDKKPLVTEVKEVQEEPVFPLVTKKLPATVKPAPAAVRSQSASSAVDSNVQTVSNPSKDATTLKTQFTQLGTTQLLGKPVNMMQIDIQLPAGLNIDLDGGLPQGLKVDVCGRQLFIRYPGYLEYQCELPLAAHASRAAAQLDCNPPGGPVIRLSLPYMSITEYAAACAACAPHAPGSLQLNSSSTALELEV